ncbi:carbon storage regulator CsrA [Paenibacillus sp. JJ-223]|uniref:carbon storage regulator CsrA n=1 Tax=Paenibacillus sp. JJ-223 TaxID=2905647 RepID=UPI001F3256D1|nr:carbon storage regulator CsrA [Paenibacillus sp. JJ-223]CAH1223839.1 Translational regulator CsrA [Paenibacillus sp. JJ-223]
MLVLSRKKGESIVIADNIILNVISVDGENVKIGITAPRDIEIYRKEILDAIQQSNQDAAMDLSKLKDEVKKLNRGNSGS